MKQLRWIAACVLACVALASCGDAEQVTQSDAVTETPTSTPTATATSAPTPEPGKCDEVKYEPVDESGTTHPNSNFYEPGADGMPSHADLDHLLLKDNAVVVTYAADTPKKTRTRLYDWTYADVVERTPIVVPDDSPDALPVRARIATVELRCNGFDWKRLTAFANRTDIAPLARED